MGFKNSEERKKYLQKYFKSEIGVLRKLFHHMKERSKKNNWKFEFKFEEFKYWAYNFQSYKEIYDNYVKNNYQPKLKPSINRLNDYGIYEYQNMEIITWNRNWVLGQESEKNKKSYNKTFSKYRKSLQYKVKVSKGDFEKIYNNFNEILEDFLFMIKSKICLCVKGERKHHHNYTFEKVEVVAQ